MRQPDRLPADPTITQLNATISRLVLRRFCFKCLCFGVWAGLLSLMGIDIVGPLRTMITASVFISLMIASRDRERVAVGHWTSYDEASWFLSLEIALSTMR